MQGDTVGRRSQYAVEEDKPGRRKSFSGKVNTFLIAFELLFDVVALFVMNALANPEADMAIGADIFSLITALTFSSARTGVSAADKNLSATNVGIDYASAFLPFIGGTIAKGAKSARITKNFVQIVEATKEEAKAFTALEKQQLTDLRERFFISLSKLVTHKQKVHMDIFNEIMKNIADPAKKPKTIEQILEKYRKSVFVRNTKRTKDAFGFEKLYKAAGKTHTTKRVIRELNKEAEKFMSAIDKVGGKDYQVLTKEFFKNAKLNKHFLTDAGYMRSIKAQLPFLTDVQVKVLLQRPKNVNKLVQNFKASREMNRIMFAMQGKSEKVYLEIANVLAPIISRMESMHKGHGFDMLNNLPIKPGGVEVTRETRKMRKTFGHMANLGLSKNITRTKAIRLPQLLDDSWESLSSQTQRLFKSKKHFKDLLYKYTTVGMFNTKLVRAVKFVGSHQFNDSVVQRVQLINPSDAGRAWVEFTSRWLRKAVRGKLPKQGTKAYENLQKGKHVVGKIEKAFVKSGGTLIPPNRYLLGFKKVPIEHPGKYQSYLLYFNQKHTGAKDPKAKNHGGKKHVIISATKKQIVMLQTEGVYYYWKVGKHEGWYTNRGGRRKGGKYGFLNEIPNEMALFIGFMPVSALRNILSIESNIVETGSDIVTGTYASQYLKKFMGSSGKTAVTRLSRLMFRDVIGMRMERWAYNPATGKGKLVELEAKRFVKMNEEQRDRLMENRLTRLADETFKEKFVRYTGKRFGFELNRYVTVGIQSTITKDQRSSTGLRVHVSGKKLLSAYANAPLASLKTIGVRSARVKGFHGRQLKHSNALSSYSNRRKFKQVRRIASASTPNVLINPRRISRLK